MEMFESYALWSSLNLLMIYTLLMLYFMGKRFSVFVEEVKDLYYEYGIFTLDATQNHRKNEHSNIRHQAMRTKGGNKFKALQQTRDVSYDVTEYGDGDE